ncbi:MAG: 30S ribosome-binding factor RbfA [Enterobacteriaceae bacterium]
MRKKYRKEQFAKLIQKEISYILQNSIDDPRISMISVINVKMSCNLSHAKIHVSFLKNKTKEEMKNTIFLLKRASGYIKKVLKDKIKFRSIPSLSFLYDIYWEKRSKIIKSLN